MAAIGTLSLAIKEQGGQVVANRLKLIDAEAKTTAKSFDALTGRIRIGGIAEERARRAAAAAAAEQQKATWAATTAAEQSVQVVTKQETTTQQASRAVGRHTTATKEQAQVQQRQTEVTRKQEGATKALGGTFTAADGQLTAFGKRGISAINGLAFAFASMANTGTVSLRSVAGQLNGVLSMMGRFGAVASIGATVGLAMFDIIRAGQKRAIDRMALESQTAIRNALTKQKAFLDLEEANQEFAYTQGLQSLRSFYQERSRIIEERGKAEIKARRDEAAALEREARQREQFVQIAGRNLPDALRADTLTEIDQLLAKARTLRAEAVAANAQTVAAQTQNTQQRIAAERQLRDLVLAFESRRREAQSQTHALRLEEIERESADFAKALALQGVAQDDATARVRAFRDAMRAQAGLAQAHLDITNIQTQLDTQRLAVQKDLEAGKINEAQAAEKVAAIENSMLPTLRELVKRALEFAAALGDRGALSALQRLQAELNGLGGNIELNQLRAAMQGRFKALGGQIGLSFGSAISEGLQSALVKGSGKNFAEAFGNTLLAGLGSIFVQLGSELIAFGLIMTGLLPFLANPFTSGAAAIAAGTALVAAGAAMSAIATNNTGRRTGGGKSAAAKVEPDVSNIQVADGITRRAGSAQNVAGMKAAPALAPVTINTMLLNPNDPASQRLLAQAVRAGQRRGL